MVQGLAEFLPISSSGHLVVFRHITNSLPNLDEQLLFDTFLHMGTLFAVLLFFRDRIFKIIRQRDYKTVFLVFAGSVPTAVIGLVFKDQLNSLFGSLQTVSVMLCVTGIMLFLTRFIKAGDKTIGFRDAFLIGVIQGIAIIPGISRSGSTIAVSLFLGVKREEAGVFSFLLSIPAVTGALMLQIKDYMEMNNGVDVSLLPIGIGTMVAFVCGLGALKLLMGFVKGGRLYQFSYWCILVGLSGFFVVSKI
jgi:undecaprenyl-diphosphatase